MIEREHPYHRVTAESAARMSRTELIDWLIWCDSNGVWSDQDAIDEGYQPLTKPEAYQAVIQILNSNI